MNDRRDPAHEESREPLQRETLFIDNDRHRLSLLLVVAALGGVGVGFGLATMAYNTRGLPPLARVAHFDLGPSATPSLLRAPHCENDHGLRGAATGPMLGVELQSLTGELGAELEVPGDVDHGAVVTWVLRHSPAQAAGIEAGDVVISVDRDGIASPGDLVRAIRARHDGDDITVTVVRNGNRKSLLATLSRRAVNGNRR